MVNGEDVGEETVGFGKGLVMGFVVIGEGMGWVAEVIGEGMGLVAVMIGEGIGLVAEVGEGLEDVGLKVDVGEGLGFDLIEAEEVLSESSTFSVVSPPIRLLALTHSASTSATISPHGVNVSKLKIDEISPSSVLKRSFVGGIVASLTFKKSFDDVGPSCGV